VRSVTAVHNLINNKVVNVEREALQDAADRDKEASAAPAVAAN
jgi:hypothetical protein